MKSPLKGCPPSKTKPSWGGGAAHNAHKLTTPAETQHRQVRQPQPQACPVAAPYACPSTSDAYVGKTGGGRGRGVAARGAWRPRLPRGVCSGKQQHRLPLRTQEEEGEEEQYSSTVAKEWAVCINFFVITFLSFERGAAGRGGEMQAGAGTCRQLLGPAGTCWQLRGGVGSYGELVAGAGSCWHVRGDAGT